MRVRVVSAIAVAAAAALITGALAGPYAPAPVRPEMPRIPPDALRFDPPPYVPPPSCGDPSPTGFAIDASVPPLAGAYNLQPGVYVTPADNILHLHFLAHVKNIGRQPAGGVPGYQFVTVTQQPTGGAPVTQVLRAAFRPLNAGETQSFAFEMRVPIGKGATGAWTLTSSLSYAKGAPATLRAPDCVMTDNVYAHNFRFWR